MLNAKYLILTGYHWSSSMKTQRKLVEKKKGRKKAILVFLQWGLGTEVWPAQERTLLLDFRPANERKNRDYVELGNKRGSGGESAAAGFLAGGLMTGAEALPNGAEQDWGSSWGLPGEGKQQWRSAGCEGWRWEPGEGGSPVLELLLHQQQCGTRWHLPELQVFVQAAGRPVEPSLAALGSFMVMKHGWGFEEWQVCAGEADFHVGKSLVPLPGWPGGWPCAIPSRAGGSPEQSPSVPPTAPGVMCRERGGRRGRQSSTWKLSSKTRRCRL